MVFHENEPGGGIIGVSGLLLGLGALRGIDAVCLMGVTSGYLVDPKAAQEVLRVLCNSGHRSRHASFGGTGKGDGEDHRQAPGDGEGPGSLRGGRRDEDLRYIG